MFSFENTTRHYFPMNFVDDYSIQKSATHVNREGKSYVALSYPVFTGLCVIIISGMESLMLFSSGFIHLIHSDLLTD